MNKHTNPKADEDFSDKKWKAIYSEYHDRFIAIRLAHKEYEEFAIENGKEHVQILADIFVEKAQKELDEKSKRFSLAGLLSTLIISATLFVAIYASYHRLSDTSPLAGLNSYSATVYSLLILSFGGLILTLLYIFTNFALAAFHEYTVLQHRRHALRFGRLTVHIFESQGKELDLDQLKEAFSWNRDFPTAFQKIRTEAIKDGVFAQVSKSMESMIEKILKKMQDEKPNGKN